MKKYLVTEKETGCLIYVFDSIEEAKDMILHFEDIDKDTGIYSEGSYEIVEEERVIVDYYTVEIKYTGNITDYSVDELLEMARAKQARNCNFSSDDEIEMNIDSAKKIDRVVKVITNYPNHICRVGWTEIREED
jgi:hypothetical protein